MQSYHFHRRRKCGGRQKLLSSQGPIRGGGCNRSDLGERIRSHWIRSPPAVCQSCQRPQWSKHKGYLKCPRTHVPAGGWSSFSLLAPPILAICPFAALPSCAFAALRPPFRRKTVSSSALPQRGGGLLRVDDKPFYSSSVSLRGRQPAWLTTAPDECRVHSRTDVVGPATVALGLFFGGLCSDTGVTQTSKQRT